MDHVRLKTKPLARAAKRREEMITLENMISERCREVYGEKRRPGLEVWRTKSGEESHSG
jgi:hypothetical protein